METTVTNAARLRLVEHETGTPAKATSYHNYSCLHCISYDYDYDWMKTPNFKNEEYEFKYEWVQCFIILRNMTLLISKADLIYLIFLIIILLLEI